MPKRRTRKESPKNEFQFILLQGEKATGSQKRVIRSKAANHVYDRRKEAFGVHPKCEVDSIQSSDPFSARTNDTLHSGARISHAKRTQHSHRKGAAGNQNTCFCESEDEITALPSKDLSILPELWLPSNGCRTDPYNSCPVIMNAAGHRILDFCLATMIIDIPVPGGGAFLVRTKWFPVMLSNSTLFKAGLAVGSALLNLKLFQKDPATELFMRQRAIIAINKDLENEAIYPSDELMSAVHNMAFMESICKSPSFSIHMSGLKRMVEVRGGLEKLGMDGLYATMIRWLDFNHAKTHGTQLFFDQSIEVGMRQSPVIYKQPHPTIIKVRRATTSCK